MGDPDLAELWDAHCRHEFESRDVDATMATMVAEPYVNHIPTMTGGVGYDDLHYFYSNFYSNHFVGVNPPDLELAPVSRTVGDKLSHEHIYWDQASVLLQPGLLEADGLPIACAATAHKVRDVSFPSNTLIP